MTVSQIQLAGPKSLILRYEKTYNDYLLGVNFLELRRYLHFQKCIHKVLLTSI